MKENTIKKNKNFLVMIFILISFISSFIIYQESIFNDRNDFYYLEVRGYDPKEPFRGNYIKLNIIEKNTKENFEIYKNFYDNILKKRYQPFSIIFYNETNNLGLNILKIKNFSETSPKFGIYAEAYSTSHMISRDSTLSHSYKIENLEQFFKPKKKALRIESKFLDRNSKFYVKIQYNGKGDMRLLNIVKVKNNITTIIG